MSPPPKYVSVLWVESQTVSTIPSMYVIDACLMYNFDLIGRVEYPDGEHKNVEQHQVLKACVFQAGSNKRALEKAELKKGLKKIEELNGGLLKEIQGAPPNRIINPDESPMDSSESDAEDSNHQSAASGRHAVLVRPPTSAAMPTKGKRRMDEPSHPNEDGSNRPTADEPTRVICSVLPFHQSIKDAGPSASTSSSPDEEPHSQQDRDGEPLAKKRSTADITSISNIPVLETTFSGDQVEAFAPEILTIQEERDTFKAETEKLKEKCRRLKLENQRLKALNDSWQRRFLQQSTAAIDLTTTSSAGSPSTSSEGFIKAKANIIELAESTGLIKYVSREDIENVCQKNVGLDQSPKWTIVVGDLMILMWSTKELLNGCIRGSEGSEKSHTPLNPEKVAALVSFIRKKYSLPKSSTVNARMGRKLRDMRKTFAIKQSSKQDKGVDPKGDEEDKMKESDESSTEGNDED